MKKKPNDPVNQHTVPRSFLVSFADPVIAKRAGKDRIWVYEKGKSPRLGSPRGESCRNDYYTLMANGEKDYRVERALANFEAVSIPIIRQIVSGRRGYID